MNKIISIITVTYNASNVLENTIKSVINQDFLNYEYIIIDGNSSDNTKTILDKYRNRISLIISERDKGIYDAMNKGINHSKGEWIIFMNAGDTFYSNNVLSKVFNNPAVNNYDAIYGNINKIYNTYSKIVKPYNIKTLKEKMAFSHQAIFVKSIIHKQYPFLLKYSIAADYNFFYNMYRNNFQFYYLDITIANYDAECGISAKKCIQARKENGIINGMNKSIIWNFKYIFFIIKVRLLSLLPNRIRNYLRKIRNISGY